MKKNNMESSNINFEIDDAEQVDLVEVKSTRKEYKEENTEYTNTKKGDDKPLINCLRNERIIVRHVPKKNGLITNPKHVLFGGMAENATRTFVVPKLSSGLFVNILTDDEKNYLEYIMGLKPNALSIYNRENNFWSNNNENGISKVRLTKQDTYLDLRSPEDYIKYKILLANKDYIAPSLQVLQDRPKATYQFVIISEGDETKLAKNTMDATMKSYKEFGKIENDIDTLRLIVELIDGRPTSSNVKLEFLHSKVNSLIQSNSKLFLRTVSDPLLNTKVLIKKSIEAGLIAKRGDFLYLKSDNSPLCEFNEEPTFNIAAKYLNEPKHQELKFSLEAKVKE